MKIRNYILFFIVIVVTGFVIYNINKVEKNISKKSFNDGFDIDGKKSYVTNVNFDVPTKSGPIANVPWEQNSNFKKVQTHYKTDVLLAAFATVLKDTMPGELHNVHLATKSVSGTIIYPSEVFSQNESIGPYVQSRGYKEGFAYIGGEITPSIGGGVCKVASTLYNVAIVSNLEIVERHNHSMPVNYLPYGQDATVAYGFKDLKFKNNTNYPILIWAVPIDNIIYIAFYGKEKPPKVQWQHNILEKRKTYTQYRINNNLADGEEKVIVKGMDGAKVESFLNIEYSDGTVQNKNVGISSYWPMLSIVEVKKH